MYIFASSGEPGGSCGESLVFIAVNSSPAACCWDLFVRISRKVSEISYIENAAWL